MTQSCGTKRASGFVAKFKFKHELLKQGWGDFSLVGYPLFFLTEIEDLPATTLYKRYTLANKKRQIK